MGPHLLYSRCPHVDNPSLVLLERRDAWSRSMRDAEAPPYRLHHRIHIYRCEIRKLLSILFRE